MDSGPKFTGLDCLNAGGIAREHMSFRFSISCPIPDVFAIKVGSCVKLVQILHVLAPRKFLGEGPRIFGHGLSNWSRLWSRGKVSWRSALFENAYFTNFNKFVKFANFYAFLNGQRILKFMHFYELSALGLRHIGRIKKILDNSLSLQTLGLPPTWHKITGRQAKQIMTIIEWSISGRKVTSIPKITITHFYEFLRIFFNFYAF